MPLSFCPGTTMFLFFSPTIFVFQINFAFRCWQDPNLFSPISRWLRNGLFLFSHFYKQSEWLWFQLPDTCHTLRNQHGRLALVLIQFDGGSKNAGSVCIHLRAGKTLTKSLIEIGESKKWVEMFITALIAELKQRAVRVVDQHFDP